MSKLPKLKTGRNEKLENSAFSLNVAPSLKKFRIANDNHGENVSSYGTLFTVHSPLHTP